MIEIQNPFTNGKLVATNYDQREYVKQEPGVQRGDRRYVMSRSDLMEFSKCPSRWRRGYRDMEEGTDATDWGSLIDCLLFDAPRFGERFAVKPETYESEDGEKKKWNGNAKVCKEWLASNADKMPVSSDDFLSSKTAITRLQNDPVICSVLGNSDFQVYCTADYKDRDTGVVVPVKTLSDIVPRDGDMSGQFPSAIIDFKTGKSANPAWWDREVNSRGYDVQAAMNLDVYNAATGEERFEFYHIIQESYAPFETSFPLLSSEFLEKGRNDYLNALKLYARCIKENHYPGYDEMFPVKASGHPIISPSAFMIK